jgi:hypothetical protein
MQLGTLMASCAEFLRCLLTLDSTEYDGSEESRKMCFNDNNDDNSFLHTACSLNVTASLHCPVFLHVKLNKLKRFFTI